MLLSWITTITLSVLLNAQSPANAGAKWEVSDGTSDITGDRGPTEKSALENWTAACKEWKKEFKADNKENQVINLDCGEAECGGSAGSKSCASTAKYKIKMKMD